MSENFNRTADEMDLETREPGDQAGESSSSGDQGNDQEVQTATAAPLLRLARKNVARPLAADAPEGTKPETEVVYSRPPTFDGEVRQFGRPPIFLPALEEQRAGFTPYFVKTDAKGREVTPFELDKDSGQLAARALRDQYPTIYVEFKEKGA